MSGDNRAAGVFGRGVGYVHMLGVDGISMSGLAELLLARGIRVSGSDLKSSERTARLTERGAVIYEGNSRTNINPDDPPDLLVYTAAAGADNPERVRAAELRVPCVERAVLLGWFMAEHELSVGVSGTHGKTTTCFMIASVLLADGCDPTFNIGGEHEIIGGNYRVGGRELFLAETCEYTDTFLKMRPTIAVITNIEYDHTDYFRDIAHMRASFKRYAAQAGKCVVANADDENVGIVMRGPDAAAGCDAAAGAAEFILFSAVSPDADFYAADIEYDENNNGAYNLVSKRLAAATRVKLRVPGLHNIYNSLAAAAASITAGCSLSAVAAGLSGYESAGKRYEYKGRVNGFDIVDDYAHHPTAVRHALESARKNARGGRLICVFQPHTYTRTRTFLKDFAEAFTAADLVLLADIYPAREADPGDISSAILADEINGAGGDAVMFPGGFPDIADYILKTAKQGDLVLTMGAGLASAVADILLAK